MAEKKNKILVVDDEKEIRDILTLLLGDEDKGYNPGYSFHGRMLALGQVEGMMCAVRDEMSRAAAAVA